MGVAVLLPLYPYLSGDTHTARSARQEATKRPRVGFLGGGAASASQDGVSPVKEVFRDYRFVLAFVYFPGVAEVSVINRVRENA
ncbi:hypothetical protein A3I28_00745 [Candidatus Giovannonibacteria bacterium RIFCSPLOWO2_02_FULL_43_37]|nr:MAG: hypothetical protein A3I28_00745 [Candidatus Giovannonibacteria bacterium RIFCSPLOWO2_02_FULL_43_37]